ncbi:hypothetical protein C7410_114141 [Paraburkholderia silvatlantica]|uniref:Uncharacterized protein n=1 Tax=Paraburkholderia silvatlantica TaxID=321895 RepID=A0A2V4TZV8_9BURK|nr:hypothetical protein C7410_114141 [Paraburkholderia silvatlantica]
MNVDKIDIHANPSGVRIQVGQVHGLCNPVPLSFAQEIFLYRSGREI